MELTEENVREAYKKLQQKQRTLKPSVNLHPKEYAEWRARGFINEYGYVNWGAVGQSLVEERTPIKLGRGEAHEVIVVDEGHK